MRIEVVCPSKDRYSNLALLLWSLCEQSYQEWDLTIIDDSEDRKDIREIPFILPILRRMDRGGNKWRVEFGSRKGPHHSHQLSVDKSRHSLIFRVDDDCICSSDVLNRLVDNYTRLYDKKVGAIGPIVLDPMMPEGYEYLPIGFESFKKYQGRIDQYGQNFGDHQWRRHPDDKLQDVQHLYSSFLYSVEAAKSIGGYDLEYDKPGHREETDFTYRLWQNGYKLVVNPKALVWHLRSPSGGIRTFSDGKLWENCQERFIKKFGFKTGKNEDQVINIFGGLGDHLCATPLIRAVKKSGAKVLVSAIYPYLFQGNKNIDELIFINDLGGYKNVRNAEIYKWGFDNNFNDKLSKAICKAYGSTYDNDALDYYIYLKEKELAESIVGDKKVIIISTGSALAITQYIDTTLYSSPKKARTLVKCWVKEEWIEVVSELRKMGYLVWQVGISGEEKIEGCDSYLFDLDSRNVIAILDKCVTWVAVDSFLNHAGHAIKKPGVVLFGPTDPKIFGHDSNLNIYHSNSCLHKSCLKGREAKFQWLTHEFECKDHDCMRSIRANEVLANLYSSLKIWTQKL